MKAKRLLSVFALTASLCLSAPQGARAGGPAPNATGATVRGMVRLQGKAPAPKPINMAADPSCAKLHPTPVMSQDVMVDAQGALQNVVVFVSEGLGDRTFEPPAQPAVIEQKGCIYEPHVKAIRANQKLELVNDDSTAHNIHPQPSNNREWNKAEPPGTKMEEAFAREEIAHSREVQRAPLDEKLHRGVQTPVLRSDWQGWKLRSQQFASGNLHAQSLARKTGHVGADGHHSGE